MSTKKLIIGLLFTAYLFGCKPDKVTTDSADKLDMSLDTVVFDTILTHLYSGTTKSVNRQFVVRNKNKSRKIKTSITLAGGEKSQFRLNVDGDPGIQFGEVEIRPGDSVFVFVEAYANPNHDPKGDPLIIRDSIIFLTNGNYQNVQLVAWGQDANYFYNDSASADMIWADKTKPYVVYNYFHVKPNVTLTIKEGVRVYFAPYSHIYTEGTLKVQGTKAEPVIFEGDRTSDRYKEPKYYNIPGQWYGLQFRWPSKDNIIRYARIKNATYGIVMDSSSFNTNPNLMVYNTIVQNMSVHAVLGNRSKVYIENSVLANCGSACLYTYRGGDYDLRHVTISGYSDFGAGADPALAITNRLRNSFGQVLEIIPDLKFILANCIVYGDLSDEIVLDVDPNVNPKISPEGNLIKTTSATFKSPQLKNVINADPMFKDYKNYNLDLDSLSPAIDIGIGIGIPKDIIDRLRDSKPDAGAYERPK